MSEHHHRSLFSAKNRAYKGSSKRATDRKNRGKVDSSSHLASASTRSQASKSSVNSTAFSSNTPGTHRIPLKHSMELSTKEARQHRAKQLRTAARAEMFQKKRIGNKQGPPKIVALVPLSATVDLQKLVGYVQSYANTTQEGVAEEMKKVEKSTNPLISSIAVNMSGRQRRLTVYSTPRDTNSVLDIAKVADIILFVLGSTPTGDDIDIDAFGTHALTILKSQGMPAVIGLQVGLNTLPPKKVAALKKLGHRYFDTACGDDTKVLQLDSESDASHFFRWIASDMKLKPITWRDARPYLLAEQCAFELNQTQPLAAAMPATAPGQFSFTMPTSSIPAASSSSSSSTAAPLLGPTGTLRIRGYLRGDNPLNPNQLMHLTGFGDYQILRVEGRVEEAVVYQSEKEKKASRAASRAASKMPSRRGSIGGGDEEMKDEQQTSASTLFNPSMFSSLTPAASSSAPPAVAGDVTLVKPTPEEQESLDGLVPIDTLAGEQSWIGDDELAEEDDEGMDEEDGGDEYGDEDDGEDDDGDDDDAAMSDDEEDNTRDTSGRIIESGRRKKLLAQQQPKKPKKLGIRPAASKAALAAASKPGALVSNQVAWDDAVPVDEVDEQEDAEAEQVFSRLSSSMMNDVSASSKLTPALTGPSSKQLEKIKLERDEQQFRDEVEFPVETLCRERFAKYKGLKSFQKSPWDSKLMLPMEYGRIYNFANFEASKNRVLKDSLLGEGIVTEANSVLPQRFYPVTVYLKDVPQSIAQTICTTLSPIVAFGIFKYEHKVSVVHMSIKRANEYQEPIKGKEPMEFHIGFRRFVARPVYSEEGKGDKHLCTRFAQAGHYIVASIYSRIVFPPASVIMFKPNQYVSELLSTKEELPKGTITKALQPVALTNINTTNPVFTPIIASGSLLTINPDRLLIKRIFLTGTPISVHKRNAVVRHMFFNAEDVKYFKPIELTTKYGLVGHIKESRGTKGYFKCEFDKFITQNDTVCMALYKRQYPPWCEELFDTNL